MEWKSHFFPTISFDLSAVDLPLQTLQKSLQMYSGKTLKFLATGQ